MSSRPTIVLISLIALLGVALCDRASAQQRRADAVAGEGTAREFWVAETFVDQENIPTTSLRQRTDVTSGKWTEIARVQDRVSAMAGLGDRLAIATGSDWRMVWQGGGTAGPQLPGNRPIGRLAGDGEAVWATSGPALFRWDAEHGWAERGRLPESAGAGVGSLIVQGGVPWTAYLSGKSLRVDRAEKTGWSNVAELPMTPTFKLVAGGPSPLLAWRDVAGMWTIYDLSATPPKVLRTVPTTGPSDVVIAGGSLRVRIPTTSTAVTNPIMKKFGRGGAMGPDAIAQVAPVTPHNSEWPNFFMMGLVTAALVVGMRTRTPPSDDSLTAANVRIAPVGRRFVAGVIDAAPYILGWILVSRRVAAEQIDVNDAPQMLLLPIFIGLGVYVLHVAISEYFFGRSLGKMIFRLRVVSSDGTPATPGSIVLRNLLRLIDMSLGLPLMLVLIYSTGQRFGDMAAKTLVVADLPAGKPSDSLQG